ncbi:MAG: hypothetical protein IJ397_01120 [Lachnospiraceae bacterium]|nr:hypothetical protein [Lachnospiraceae bacterium]
MSGEAESLLAGLYVLFPFLTFGMIMVFWVFIFIFAIALGIALSFPYYKMAKRAGLPNPWLVFIPFGCLYILLNLSRREFNIFNWIKTNDRTKVFWYALIGYGGYFGVSIVMAILCNIPIIQFLFIFVNYMVMLAFSFAIYVFNWRIYYDILMTYGMQEHAMWASIVSCFVPLVMTVFSFIIMNNEPDYTI